MQPLLPSTEPLTPSARWGQGPGAGSWALGRHGDQESACLGLRKAHCSHSRALGSSWAQPALLTTREARQEGRDLDSGETSTKAIHCLGYRSQDAGELGQRTVPGDCIEAGVCTSQDQRMGKCQTTCSVHSFPLAL